MLEILKNAICWIINFVILLVGNILDLLLSFLPNSPFSDLPLMMERSNLSEYFSYLSWILPIKQILSIIGLWCTCIAIYFVYSIAMRYFKVVE